MTEATITLPKGVRPTPRGKYEATIYHSSLQGGRVSRSFDTPAEAGQYRINRLAELNKGVILPELQPARPTGSTLLSQLLRHYLNSDTSKIAKSDRKMVESLQESLKGDIAGLTNTWVDAWVREMKKQRLAPSTIRKKVESLARAVDWWNRREYQGGNAPGNALRTLPKGYSSYDDQDIKDGEQRPEDVKRDRRLHQGEYEHIEQIILGKVKNPEKERAWGKDSDRLDFLMLFRVIVHTGMRLREAYRMRRPDIRFNLRTIHVPRSKTGAARDIPMTRQVEGWLTVYLASRGDEEIVFPFWGGSDDEGILEETTVKLSKRFRRMFEHAQSEGITEHDLRHEATCRWMEMKDKEGRWLFRAEEVRRITGHKSVQMFERYLSLRGSDLAERLG